ncbi:hypothetical protein [Deinococcus hohokamensis]|uniref:Lincosamide nucleotidyltransferase-like C-terminal domain-containing protein n=1 Tax=Deinococcus hohokamensis TaxID=309883 RepID=A0ABV9IB38_9DEIO
MSLHSGGLERHRALDARVRAALRSDTRVTHALAYGSFVQGTADRFSDLEYWAFLHPQAGTFDVRSWLEALTPVQHFVVNEFGTPNAVVPGLLRIELHAVSNTQLADLRHWPGEHIFPDRMLIKDQDGQLLEQLEALEKKGLNPAREAQALLDRTLNWLTFGLNVLARGERIRALELLWWVRANLLRLACLQSGHTAFWLNPSRLAEQRLPPELLERYRRLTVDLDGLEQAYTEALAWTAHLSGALALTTPADLLAELRHAVQKGG